MPSSDKTNAFSARAEQKWSKAANSYVRYFEPMTVTAGRFLLSLLKLRFQLPQLTASSNDSTYDNNTTNTNTNTNDNDTDEEPQSSKPDKCTAGLKVLEAGCGAGGLAKELLLDAFSSSSSLSISELVLTDISEGMLERARATLTDIIDDDKKNRNNGGGGIRVTIEQADFTAFDREKYPNECFDRYYTNLCLHYAEDPDTVIVEAARVLKTGGIAGFTVWGRKADSPVMTIVPEILSGFQTVEHSSSSSNNNNNHEQSSPPSPALKRSSFHMGEDDNALRLRFFKQGATGSCLFSKCTVVHYPAVLESLDPDDYVEAILDGAASTKKELEENYSPNDRHQIRQMVRDRALEFLARGEPLVLDMVMVVAQK